MRFAHIFFFRMLLRRAFSVLAALPLEVTGWTEGGGSRRSAQASV